MDDLVSYRIENAREKLESSKILLDAGHYKDSILRNEREFSWISWNSVSES